MSGAFRTSARLALCCALPLAMVACGSDEVEPEAAESEGGQVEEAEEPDSGEWEPEWADGVLQPLPSGWPDGPITLVNRGDPGSRNDVLMRALFDAVEARSPVEVVYGNEVGGGGFSSWNAYASAIEQGPDGSTPMIIGISGTVSDIHLEPITEETGLTYDDLNMLCRLEAVPYVVAVRKDAEWGRTWADLVAYAKDNPGELRYMSPPVGGGVDIAMQAMLLEAGIPVSGGFVEQVPLGQEEGVIAVAAGQGDFAIADAGTVRQHWETGRIEVMLTTASEKMEPWTDDPDFQTVAELGIKQYFQTDLGLVVAPSTPEENKAWLVELIREAHADEAYQESRRQAIPGVELEFWDPEQAQEHADFLFELTDTVLRDLGMHIEQQ